MVIAWNTDIPLTYMKVEEIKLKHFQVKKRDSLHCPDLLWVTSMQNCRFLTGQVSLWVEFATPQLWQCRTLHCWPWSSCRALVAEALMYARAATVPSKWVRWAKISSLVPLNQWNPFMLERFKWGWVQGPSQIFKGASSAASSLEGTRFLVGTATLNNVAKLHRLWAGVLISLRRAVWVLYL